MDLRFRLRLLTAWAAALTLVGCSGSLWIDLGDGHDDRRPTVSLVAGPDPVERPGTVTLSAAATDDHGVTTVQFYQLVAGNTAVLLGGAGAAPYRWSVNVTRNDNGVLYFFARAWDTAGHSADSGVVSVTVAIP